MSEEVLEIENEVKTSEVSPDIQSILDRAKENRPQEAVIEPEKEKKDEKPEETPEAKTPAAGEPKETPSVNQGKKTPEEEVELSDEALLKQLEKRGLKVESLDSLKPKEPEVDPEKEVEEKKEKVTAWAIANKKVSTKVLDEYAVEKNLSKTEVAFRLYQKERANDLNDDQEPLTEEELRNEFEDEHFLYEEETSPRRKRAEANLNNKVDAYFYNKYKGLNGLESEYDSEQAEAATKQAITATFEKVKQDVVKNGMSFKIKDDKGEEVEINIPVNKKTADEISAKLSNTPISLSGKEDDDTIHFSDLLKKAILANSPETILHEFATAYHSKKLLQIQAGSVGITNREAANDKVIQGEVSKEVQAILDEAKARSGNK